MQPPTIGSIFLPVFRSSIAFGIVKSQQDSPRGTVRSGRHLGSVIRCQVICIRVPEEQHIFEGYLIFSLFPTICIFLLSSIQKKQKIKTKKMLMLRAAPAPAFFVLPCPLVNGYFIFNLIVTLFQGWTQPLNPCSVYSPQQLGKELKVSRHLKKKLKASSKLLPSIYNIGDYIRNLGQGISQTACKKNISPKSATLKHCPHGLYFLLSSIQKKQKIKAKKRRMHRAAPAPSFFALPLPLVNGYLIFAIFLYCFTIISKRYAPPNISLQPIL